MMARQIYRVELEVPDANFPPAIDAEDVRSAIESELERALSPEVASAVQVEQVDPSGRVLDAAGGLGLGNPPGSLNNIDHSYDMTEPPGDDADVLPPA